MTVLGVVTALVVVVVWFARREWIQYVLGATAVFPQTAALIVLNNGFPLFYLAVLLVAVLSIPYLLLALAHPGTVPAIVSRRGFRPDLIVLCLLAWSAIITFAGPRMFAGMRVFSPDHGIDTPLSNLAHLAPSLGNLAQLGYLTIAVVFVLLAGRLFPVDGRLVATVVWLSVGLAALRLVGEPWWPRELLQNMPGFNYATPERLSGTFHEPSVLGLYLTAAAGFFGAQLIRKGRARIAAIIGLLLVAVDFAFNNSGTAVIGLGAIAVIATVLGILRFATSSRLRVQPWLLAVSLTLLAVSVTQLPLIYSLTIGYAQDKAGSGSFFARSESNLRSFQIFLESYGAGVGLGSNRPSSFFFFVLSCLGVIGLAFLAALVWSALARTSSRFSVLPVGWALIGTIAAMISAVPDLSAPLLWTTVVGCLALGHARRLNPGSHPHLVTPNTPPLRVAPPTAPIGVTPNLGSASLTPLVPDTRLPQFSP